MSAEERLRKQLEDIKQTPQGLTTLSRMLGYRDQFHQLMWPSGEGCVGDILEFLEDNLGACQAVIEWAMDNAKLFLQQAEIEEEEEGEAEDEEEDDDEEDGGGDED